MEVGYELPPFVCRILEILLCTNLDYFCRCTHGKKSLLFTGREDLLADVSGQKPPTYVGLGAKTTCDSGSNLDLMAALRFTLHPGVPFSA